MRKFFRKFLIYLLAIGMLCPAWLATGVMKAERAKAYDGTEVPRNVPSVIINEFVSNPNSGNNEWVELLNTTNSSIDLADGSGWTIKDTANTAKSLSSLGLIPAKGVVVFTESDNWLNNSSAETIKITNGSGIDIDSVGYNSTGQISGPTLGESAAFVDGSWKTDKTPTKDLLNDRVTNQFGLAYTTIEKAIQKSSSGDEISMAAGTYAEDIIIDKSLTLTGSGNPTIKSITLKNSAIVSGSIGVTSPIVKIEAGAKISDGILLVSSNGTITVNAGTYNGNLAIDKSLTLTGSGNPTINPAVITVDGGVLGQVSVNGFNLGMSPLVTNNTTISADISKNWWGTAVMSEIGSRTSGNVRYVPFYSDATMTNLSDGTDSYSVYTTYPVTNALSTITADGLVIKNVSTKSGTGDGSITVRRYIGAPTANAISTGANGLYYNIEASSNIQMPLSIEINYSDDSTASNYLDENKFVSLYYFDAITSTWKDYRLDSPNPSTVTIDTNAKQITAFLQHLTPIVPVIDITSPAAPQISSSTVSGKTINLRWSTVTDAAYYYVYSASKANGFITKDNPGIKSGKIYDTKYALNVGNYGNYYVVVTAVDKYGNESALPTDISKELLVTVTVPVAAAPAPVETTPVTVGPTKVEAAAPAENKVETPSDENGQIKGDENTSDSEEKTNWTPWIVLFVLIILAGAATGGYFYWFNGEEEVKAVAVEPKKTGVKKEENVVKTTVRDKNSQKKQKRW